MADFPSAVIPEVIRREAETALSHYPALKSVRITFQFADLRGKSFMLAQPDFYGTAWAKACSGGSLSNSFLKL